MGIRPNIQKDEEMNMDMTYECFVEELRKNLLEETDYKEDMICYKKEEEYPPTTGDRLLLKRQQGEGACASLSISEHIRVRWGTVSGWRGTV